MTEQPKMKEALIALEKSTIDMASIVAALDPNDIPNLVRAFRALAECRQLHEAIGKIIDENYRKLSEDVIPEAFDNAGIDSVKVNGRNFYITTRINASSPQAKQDAGFAWLRNTAKCPELIAERVNAKQLSSLVTRYFEEHGAMPPEEAVTIHMQRLTSMRKT